MLVRFQMAASKLMSKSVADAVLSEDIELRESIQILKTKTEFAHLTLLNGSQGRLRHFRARTSSASWTSTNRLTMQEQREYVRRMGFK